MTVEDQIIVREFKDRGNRKLLQLLYDIQAKLKELNGKALTMNAIIHRCGKLGIKVMWP